MHDPWFEGELEPARVLVIDDSVMVHRLVDARLRSEGVILTSATTAEEGLEKAIGELPDLILLDLELPGVDGFECLRRLKDHPGTVQIPVIVLSGLTGPQDKVVAFELGAVDYVTKPFEATELRVRVRSALRMSMLVKLLAQKAQIDGLTGLWNRVFFDERLRSELSRAERYRRPMSLAMFDIDHFKSINDTYGHPAGDEVLQRLARMVRGQIRQSDLPCRYGGEEFALVMPDTPPKDAVGVCERIREELKQITWPRHPGRAVTCSAGVVGTTGEWMNESGAAWVEGADRALYRAKQTGRDRVVVGEIEGAPPVRLTEAG